jgi:hypothetical protein
MDSLFKSSVPRRIVGRQRDDASDLSGADFHADSS